MNLVLIEAIPLLLRAICQAVETLPGHKIYYHSHNLQHLEMILQDGQADLLWLDASIPEVHNSSAFQSIHKNYPGLKILLFGVGETVPEIRKYFKQGVSAYLPKSADLGEIESAFACIEAGELYVPSYSRNLFANWLDRSGA